MSTTLVAPPQQHHRTTPRNPLRRALDLRRSSPGRLQLFLALLLALGLLTGVVAGLAAHEASSGTADLAGRAQPLAAQAETIYASLADADMTASQGFLSGGLEPVALTNRYNDDLAQATAALTAAGRLTGSDDDAARQVGTLVDGLPQYVSLVATANADNRQGLPLGSSYLSAASSFSQATLLPTAKLLFDDAQSGMSDGYGTAAGEGWLALFVIALIALIAALVACQLYLSRHTHRTFNLPLVGATVATAVLAVLTGGILAAQNTHLDRAQRTGSVPVARIASGHILALQARGAELLALAAHGSADEAQAARFGGAKASLLAANGPFSHPYVGTGDKVATTLDKAKADLNTYLNQHAQVDKQDQDGRYDQAVALATGPATTDAFNATLQDLADARTDRQAVFTSEIHAAERGLGLLTLGGPILALLICALAYAGMRPRLQEYR